MSIFRPAPSTRFPPPGGRSGRPARTTGWVASLAAAWLWAAGLAAGGCIPPDLRDRHASVVERYRPTPGAEAGAPFLDPTRALGPPDGRTVALGTGSFVVLRFFREIRDGSGFDLRIYEVGPDGAEAKVSLSGDGETFVDWPGVARGPVFDLDLEDLGLDRVTFVRVEGLDDAGLEPGFDLDAVEALH